MGTPQTAEAQKIGAHQRKIQGESTTVVRRMDDVRFPQVPLQNLDRIGIWAADFVAYEVK